MRGRRDLVLRFGFGPGPRSLELCRAVSRLQQAGFRRSGLLRGEPEVGGS